MSTVVLADSCFLNHRTPQGHPERPERLQVLLHWIESFEHPELQRLTASRSASEDELRLVHSMDHIERMASTSGHASVSLDLDTYTSAQSYETALLAAGGVLDVIDAVMKGSAATGMALVRPPGHHAEADRAMGFCLFGNAAIAAKYLVSQHGLSRVLVVDWDVHHGNGTQHLLYDDGAVLFMSTHQYPYYPGTGSADETGSGEGAGFTVNVPMPAGCGDAEYVAVFERVIIPCAKAFRPEFVLISAGFDAHHRDPLAQMRVSDMGFAHMAGMLLETAAEFAGGRCVAILEGGYHLDALRDSVQSTLGVLLSAARPETGITAARNLPWLEDIAAVHREYWPL